MVYIFLVVVALFLVLATFFGPRSPLIFSLSILLLLGTFYFLLKGDSASAENFAKLFFVSFLLMVLIFRSGRFLTFLKKFFEVD